MRNGRPIIFAAFVVVLVSVGVVMARDESSAWADDSTIVCTGNGTTSLALLHPGCQKPTPASTSPPTVKVTTPNNTLPYCATVENGIRTCNLRNLGNGLEFFALVTCLAGLFVSAILWSLGSKGQNPGQELTGKRGILVCVVAALLIGAYPSLSTFFNSEANQSDKTGVTKATLTTVTADPNPAPHLP